MNSPQEIAKNYDKVQCELKKLKKLLKSSIKKQKKH